jgi:hypothetical protein
MAGSTGPPEACSLSGEWADCSMRAHLIATTSPNFDLIRRIGRWHPPGRGDLVPRQQE